MKLYEQRPTQLASDIAKIKSEGYSDEEVVGYLATDTDVAPKVRAALAEGYTPEEIVGHYAGQQMGIKDRLLREAGLSVRPLVEGVAQTADMLTAPIRAGINAVLPEGMQSRPIAPMVGDALGLPKPETAGERVVQDATRSGYSAMGGIGLAKAAQPVGAMGQAVKQALTTAPGLQGVSAATGGASAGVAREQGAGPGGQLVAGIIGGMLPGAATSLLGARGSQLDPGRLTVLKEGRKLGYVTPPSQSNPSILNQALEGAAGKLKTAQAASVKNQPLTQSLTKRALGIADDTPLSVEALEQVRKNAGQAYETARALGVMQPGKSYFDQLDDAVKTFTKSAQSFPDAKLPPVVGDIAALKAQAIDADSAVSMISIIRDKAKQSFAGQDAEAGRAYSAAAKALENLLEDHAVKIGAPQEVVKQLRQARALIAKTYSVQKAMNAASGVVSAPKLGAQLERGKPLDGDLRTVAKIGSAYKQAMQPPEHMGSVVGLSPFDYGTAALGYGTSGGNPLTLAGLVARPALRSLLLSKPYQNTLASPEGLLSLSPSELIGAGAIGTQYGLQNRR